MKNTVEAEEIRRDENAAAVLLIYTHLCETLQQQFHGASLANELWLALESRFGDRENVMLPRALQDMKTIRFTDFATVGEFQTALSNIVARLKYCGKDTLVCNSTLIELTLNTMSPTKFMLDFKLSPI
jgi:hypothetical protein